MTAQSTDYPLFTFFSQAEWENWLATNHEQTKGVWLRFAKKKSGLTTINYDEALDVALCYGWIDSQTKPLNKKYYLQKFTPRSKRSMWSKVNREHIARLQTAKKPETREKRIRLILQMLEEGKVF